MPLEQRVIEPIFTSRGTFPYDTTGQLACNIPNELECVTNGSLANVIRQISSLSKNAEDLFGGIITETSKLIGRTSTLQGRIDRIAIKVTQLDYTVDEVSLLDAQKKYPFKSSTSYDQQVMSRSTMPASLMEQYKLCDKPPPLSKLNAYRDDNKDGLKFYTDPTYFFELWKEQEMLQVTEREARRKPGHKVSKSNVHSANGMLPNSIVTDRSKKPRQPVNSRQRYQEDARDPEFLPTIPTTGHTSTTGTTIYADSNGYNSVQLRNPTHVQHQVPYHPHPDAYGTLRRPNSLEVENHIHASNSNAYDSYRNQVPQHLQFQQHLQHQYPQQHHSQQQYTRQQSSPGTGHQYSSGQPISIDGHHYQSNNSMQHTPPQQSTPTHRKGSTPGSSVGSTSRPSQPPPAPPSSSSSSGQATPTPVGTPSRGSRGASLTRDVLPPPPPPPPGMEGTVNGINDHTVHNHVHHLQQNSVPPPMPPAQNSPSSLVKTNGSVVGHTSASVPPPPPPPPPPMEGLIHHKSQPSTNYPAPPPPSDVTDSSNRNAANPNNNNSNNNNSNGFTNGININNNRIASTPSFAQLIQAKHQELQPPRANLNNKILPHQASTDARSELLAAIREGKQLRRVEGIKQREVERTTPCNDVASILARRAVLMELSDSDSAGGGNSGSESDPWEDEGQS